MSRVMKRALLGGAVATLLTVFFFHWLSGCQERFRAEVQAETRLAVELAYEKKLAAERKDCQEKIFALKVNSATTTATAEAKCDEQRADDFALAMQWNFCLEKVPELEKSLAGCELKRSDAIKDYQGCLADKIDEENSKVRFETLSAQCERKWQSNKSSLDYWEKEAKREVKEAEAKITEAEEKIRAAESCLCQGAEEGAGKVDEATINQPAEEQSSEQTQETSGPILGW